MRSTKNFSFLKKNKWLSRIVTYIALGQAVANAQPGNAIASTFNWSPEFGARVWESLKSGDILSGRKRGEKVDIAVFPEGVLVVNQPMTVYSLSEPMPGQARYVTKIDQANISKIEVGNEPGSYTVTLTYPGTGLHWTPWSDDSSETIVETQEIDVFVYSTYPRPLGLDIGDEIE